MGILSDFLNIFLHLDKVLGDVIRQYDVWTYLLFYVVVFCETGLVVTPFLPGDSLLFAAGTFTAPTHTASGQIISAPLDLRWTFAVFCAAAIMGDSLNYWIGRFVGPKVFRKEKVRFLNKEYLNRAHGFYERHGGKTVAIARFLPIIRTFSPFVAGAARMNYGRFLTYSVVGTLAWVSTFLLAGHYFGNIPVVQQNFVYVVMAIVVISLAPAVIGFIRAHRGSKAATSDAPLHQEEDPCNRN